MTYKEAIEVLIGMRDYDKTVCERDCVALDMAIKAMESINMIRFNVFALNSLIQEGMQKDEDDY